MNKIKSIFLVVIFSVTLVSASAMCYFAPSDEYIYSERRDPEPFPELNSKTVASGEFRNKFETYSADQFPYREELKTIKAMFSTYLLNNKEYNGLYFTDGHLVKFDGKEDDAMLDYAANLFKTIYERDLKDKNANVYFSIVPEKTAFLPSENGYPTIDYDTVADKLISKTSDFMKFIPIKDLLELNDYYRTDTHWRQEKITDVAQALAKGMGTDVSAKYTVNTLDYPFYGVYAGQSPLPVAPDKIKYLTSNTLDNCKVSYYDPKTLKPVAGEMYDMDKAYSKDPYEMFLSGVTPLVVFENPNAKTDKELVIFRDSYGSSLAPLMVEGYKKVTVVDIRYIKSQYVGKFVDFTDSDILFIYSTLLLNTSSTSMS